MMTYLIKISSSNLSRLKLKYDYVFQDLDDLLSKYTVDPESDSNFSDISSTDSTNEESLSSNTELFKDYVTLPGVTRKLLYASTESNFSLINQQNVDLYYTYRKNIVAGPSIIFSRYHEKGVSDIKKI